MTKHRESPARPDAAEADRKVREALEAAGGTKTYEVNLCLVARAILAAPREEDALNNEALSVMTRAAMTALRPTDAVEGLFAAQVVGLHHGAMACLRKATNPGQSAECAARFWRESASLSRAMIETLCALDKYREKPAHAAPT